MAESWIDGLNDEDLAFLKRFVLASGTLKDLAQQYGVSYPTVRLRLNRLIDKVELLDRQDAAGPFERALRSALADRRLDAETFRSLLDAHRKERTDEDSTHRAA